jgi:chemotaxis protein CheC
LNPTPLQTDALSELINIGIGHAAGMLNQMVGSPIRLRVPRVKVLQLSRLAAELGRGPDEILSLVRQPFAGSIQGTAALVFPPESAARLVAALTSEKPGSPDLDSVRSGTLSEVGNIVINGVMGTIANILHIRLTYGLPTYLDDSIAHLFSPSGYQDDPMVVLAHTHFVIENLDIQGTILLICEVLSFDALLAAIDAVSLDA